MANLLEYTLSLQDEMSAKLTKIGVNSEGALKVFAGLEKQSAAVRKTMSDMGVTTGSLTQKLALLKAEREWIPATNIRDLRIVNKEINKLEREINKLNNISGSRLNKWFSDLKNQIPIIRMVTNPLVMLGASIYKLGGYLKNSEQAYNAQAVAETKLAAVMRNTMNATQDQVKSILNLASAQQKLGVIGDEIQLAGAQELATYVSKKESLEALLPAMNDMLAQQYGLNATQEQAVTIAQMMGKVLDGQVGALSRYGYRFTEAQEQVLKFGNEAQRTAMLAEVIATSVGGVNAALAKTPEGKLKNAANNMSDLSERVGSLYVMIKASLLPVQERIQEVIEKIIIFFERNAEKIQAIAGIIGSALVLAFSIIIPPVEWVINLVSTVVGWLYSWIEAINQGNTVAIVFAGALGALATGMAVNYLWMKRMIIAQKLKALWDGILILKTILFTKATWALTVAMLANPIGMIVAGVMALVGAIVLVIKKLGLFKKKVDETKDDALNADLDMAIPQTPGAPTGEGSYAVNRGIDSVNGGGRKDTNINIVIEKMIETFNVKPGAGETWRDVEDKITEVLLRTLNSLNRVAS